MSTTVRGQLSVIGYQLIAGEKLLAVGQVSSQLSVKASGARVLPLGSQRVREDVNQLSVNSYQLTAGEKLLAVGQVNGQ
jgi:hypothetical protein